MSPALISFIPLWSLSVRSLVSVRGGFAKWPISTFPELLAWSWLTPCFLMKMTIIYYERKNLEFFVFVFVFCEGTL